VVAKESCEVIRVSLMVARVFWVVLYFYKSLDFMHFTYKL